MDAASQEEQITQREATERMGATERWVRKLLARMRWAGSRVAAPGLRGQPSNRKIAAKTEQKAVAIVRAECSDFGPTSAAEYLRQRHRIAASRETMRQWMMRAGIWKRRKQRLEEIHVWRRRRRSVGELAQWDTSEYDWLEGRGDRLCYIAMIDEAGGRCWPGSYGTILGEQEAGKTQIGRALEQLGIGWIGARSPPAKGRVERHLDTAQDRLVKGLRKAGANTLEGVNQHLHDVLLPWVNKTLTREAANPADAHRPLGQEHNLAAILSRVEHRLGGTLAVQFQPAPDGARLRGSASPAGCAAAASPAGNGRSES